MKVYDIIVDENKKEMIQYGLPEFLFVIEPIQINKYILGFIDWHWHKELQFCIVTSDIVDFHIKGETVTLSKGDGIFINTEQLHKVKNHIDSDGSYLCFNFNPDLIYGFAGNIINLKYIMPYLGNPAITYCTLKKDINWQSDILEKLLKIQIEYTNQNIGFELQILTLLLSVWGDMLKNYFISFSSDNIIHNTSRIKDVINYIHGHYMEKINLKDICDEINLSKGACCREFKKYMNCSIFEYITNYRLVMSEKLLITTNESITDIAYKCGFGSTSYFIEKFKLQAGMSPLTYRKENQSKK